MESDDDLDKPICARLQGRNPNETESEVDDDEAVDADHRETTELESGDSAHTPNEEIRENSSIEIEVLSKPYFESQFPPFDQKIFVCAMTIIQFFEFYSDSFEAMRLPKFICPSVFRLCSGLTAATMSDEDQILLNPAGVCMGSVLGILKADEGGIADSHWLESIGQYFRKCNADSSKSDVNLNENILRELRSIFYSKETEKSSLENSFVSDCTMRVEILSELLSAAAESEVLRNFHEARMIGIESLVSKKNEIHRRISEIDTQTEKFFIQVGMCNYHES
jgi:hypothetical protein